ncbi:hypothetical protein C8J57DRAFT_1245752 [Mycena rebaudengoi]|nr:hypothetical protein C8J57DRAFT_1245752 [Mycena rebaudengoi]
MIHSITAGMERVHGDSDWLGSRKWFPFVEIKYADGAKEREATEAPMCGQPWDVESESIMTTAGAGRGIAPEQMDRCDARWRARCVYGCIRPVDAGVGEQWSARFVDDSESHRRNHHVPRAREEEDESSCMQCEEGEEEYGPYTRKSVHERWEWEEEDECRYNLGGSSGLCDDTLSTNRPREASAKDYLGKPQILQALSEEWVF